MPVQLRPFGPTAVLAEVGGPAAALALATWARASGVAAVEIVPAAETVLFDGVDDVATLAATLESWSPTDPVPPGDLVELPVTYDGPDLEFVAEAWRTDVAGVVRRHGEVEYVASFCGFAPGFAYLAGLPAELAVPRLASPRAQVPAGSVGLAGVWCGVYPSASPGGWRLIGRTDARLWDPAGDPPALLAPGTRVRFRDASSLGSSTPGFGAS
ncbi:5-oxoprolinase subunit B family protein [Nocardioides sp. T2.26MG-1]|uniref:5-oxoprolinase subunit B family protein n=1 Tax=Nocardioides sp. T2.26MG-1 TaxID=3041166 RepID=UPI0024776C57|nr:allophanate hydrolase subunit 1 [Nocardioides sp. T2.26MG-1]CAI9412926.1 5-oxoprolinase subunit B [Nocardioides sp. T2.26MG-1]